jgi:cellulose synthase (UDP-forming)
MQRLTIITPLLKTFLFSLLILLSVTGTYNTSKASTVSGRTTQSSIPTPTEEPQVSPIGASTDVGSLTTPVEGSSTAESQSTEPVDLDSKPFVGSWEDYGLSILLIALAVFLTKKRFRLFQAKWALAALCVFLGLRYLYWRAAYTLNTEDSWATSISLIVYIAEVYGILAVLLFFIQGAKPTDRSASPPIESQMPMVDIFVTIYNESLDILYQTLVGCMAIDYPAGLKKVYALDDGNREEVKRLAERLGCQYIRRATHEHAKAGNLNHALTQSSGEFVMVLDCDHVPVRSFLKETIGFFKDPKVAFVQTPHYFYNPDTFQRNLRLEREIVNEQDLFFYVIQPGRDGYNSSFFAGSGGIFRRSALQSIGGFQVVTLTEDLHTSMVLHAKGYRSVYVNKILAAGLAPESYESYLKQRQRWTRGGIQVFLLDNPLWKAGLTVMQRVNYFGSLYYFFHGWPRLVYLTAPLSYLLLNYPPLVAPFPVLLNYFLPYYLTSFMAFNVVSKKFRNPFWSDVYETVMCFFISWTSLETVFTPTKSKFQVTPKGMRFEKAQLAWSYVMPHILLFAVLLVGLGVGGYRLWDRGDNFDATMLSVVWTVYNLIILMAAVIVARERPQKRSSPRLSRMIDCELKFGGRSLVGKTTDLSESGLSMVLNRPVLLPPVVQVRLVSDFGEATEIKGEVIRNDSSSSGGSGVGIRFLNISDAQRQSLIRQMYSSPGSWASAHQSTAATLESFAYLVTSSVRAFVKEKILRRLSSRIKKRMTCELVIGERVIKGTTEDISNTGLLVLLKTEETLAKEVTILLYHEDRVVFSARGEIVRRIKAKGQEAIYGIRFLERQDLELSSLG